MNILQTIVAALAGHSFSVNVAVNAKPVVLEDAGQEAGGPTASIAIAPTRVQQLATLREALANPKYKFRSVDKLAKAIGADRFYTEELLAELGARPSRRDAKLFGLTSRVGQRQTA